MNIGVIGYKASSIIDEIIEADFINKFPEVSHDALIVFDLRSKISDKALLNFIDSNKISHIFISASLNIYSCNENFDICEYKKMLENQLHVFWEIRKD